MNQMGIFQLAQAMRNPKQFAENALKNSQIAQNPIASNAMNMVKQGDMRGVEQLARNMCRQKGINVDEAVSTIKQNYGMYF